MGPMSWSAPGRVASRSTPCMDAQVVRPQNAVEHSTADHVQTFGSGVTINEEAHFVQRSCVRRMWQCSVQSTGVRPCRWGSRQRARGPLYVR
jgi:hypothetical protein